MGRNRVIYQSEVLYTKPIQYHEYLNKADQLLRVQELSHGVELNKTDINEFGQLGAVERKIIEPPTVNLDFSYYLHGGRNERLIGFSMTPGTSSETTLVNALKKFITGDSGQNYYIGVSAEGEDAKDDNVASRGVIGIGNGYLTSYSIEAAVGDIPSASVSVEGSNLEFNGAVVEDGGDTPSLDVPNPAIDPETNERVATNDIAYFPYANHTGEKLEGSNYEFAALRPGDIEIDFNAGGDAEEDEAGGDAPSLAIGGATVEGDGRFHLQNFTLDVPLSREALNRIGSVYPYSREVETPLTVTFTCSAFLSDLEAGSLDDILCSAVERNIRVKIWESCPAEGEDRRVAQAFLIKGASLDSQNFSASIGDNKTVDLTFSAQIGGASSTSKGLFMWQAGEVVEAAAGETTIISEPGTHTIIVDSEGADPIVDFTISGGEDVEITFTPIDEDTVDYSAESDGDIETGTLNVGETVVFEIGGNEVVLYFVSVGSYNIEASVSKLPESVAETVAVGETVEGVADKLIHVKAPDIAEGGDEIRVDVVVSTGNDVEIDIPYDSVSGRMKFELESNGDTSNLYVYDGTTDAHYIGGNIVQIETIDAANYEAKITVKDVSEVSLPAYNAGTASARQAQGDRADVINIDFSENDAITFAGWINTKVTNTSSSEREIASIGSDASGEPSAFFKYDREVSGDRRLTALKSSFRRTQLAAWEADEHTLASPQENEEWVHVGLVLNPGTQEGKFYHAGIQVGSTFSLNSGSLNEQGGSKALRIGHSSSGPDDADLSEFGVWSKELTAAEFAELADTNSQFKLTTDFEDYASSGDLQAYFPGVNSGMNLLLDYSGKANHLVMDQTDFESVADGPFSS